MNSPVSDNPIFADGLTACFKLGLDQGHDLPPICQNLVQGWQDKSQGNKADIDRGKTRQAFCKVILLSIAEIVLFHGANPLILTQFPDQLIGPHIHSVDQGCAILQHDICKAAGRGSNVNGGQPLY